MSEKRFRFEKECTENFFTEKGVFYNNERPMGANEIIALLNSLSEENEQLQKKYDNLNSAIEKTAMDMNEKRIYGREDFDVFQRITDYVEELDDEI